MLARVAGGRGNAAEESESGARIESAKAILAEADAKIRDGEALFISIVGRKPVRLADVKPPRHQLPGDVNAAVAAAREFAPSVIATRFDAVAAGAAVGGALARFSPRVNFELSGDRSGGPNYEASYRGDLSAMVVVRWNLFNGGIDKARLLEYEARAEEARNVSENTERIVEREVRISWSALQSAEIRRTALARQLTHNRRTRATYNEQFEANQRRLLDLLEIQNEVFVAEATQATEDADSRYHVYRVLAATGRLVEALSLEMPEEATRPKSANIIDGWQVRRIERTGDPHAALRR